MVGFEPQLRLKHLIIGIVTLFPCVTSLVDSTQLHNSAASLSYVHLLCSWRQSCGKPNWRCVYFINNTDQQKMFLLFFFHDITQFVNIYTRTSDHFIQCVLLLAPELIDRIFISSVWTCFLPLSCIAIHLSIYHFKTKRRSSTTHYRACKTLPSASTETSLTTTQISRCRTQCPVSRAPTLRSWTTHSTRPPTTTGSTTTKAMRPKDGPFRHHTLR